MKARKVKVVRSVGDRVCVCLCVCVCVFVCEAMMQIYLQISQINELKYKMNCTGKALIKKVFDYSKYVEAGITN